MMQAGTVANFVHKYGSFRGFLDHYRLDVLSVQARPCPCAPHVASSQRSLPAPGIFDAGLPQHMHILAASGMLVKLWNEHRLHLGSTMPLSPRSAGHASQEHKLTEPKLTRDLVCVDGFEVSSTIQYQSSHSSSH